MTNTANCLKAVTNGHYDLSLWQVLDDEKFSHYTVIVSAGLCIVEKESRKIFNEATREFYSTAFHGYDVVLDLDEFWLVQEDVF